MPERSGAPEIDALERAFAEAHEGGNGYAFASAPIAVSALLDLLDSGAHILVSEGLQADTYRMIEGIRRRSAGLRVGFVDMADLAAVEQALTSETRLLWIETLAGPRLSDPDLRAVARLARERDVYTAVDVSAATHVRSRPLEQGVHIVYSSAPGLSLGGVAGGTRGGLVAFAAEPGFAEDRFAFLQRAYDALPEPDQAAALLDALERIPEEMAARTACAGELAELLAGETFVSELLFPERGAAELSVVFEGTAGEVASALARLDLFTQALSAGRPGTYWHYARRTYEAVPDEIRLALGIPDGIVRFGVPAGEAPELLDDFRRAFG
ncbi:PLP-dependent aspartate aminotransferase family protein [Nisaea acidiphila]|uniref:PLP-dependent aspartate aminotransferase family protein n=1 Tax=Nisaea acidiphila TaxID=1862145 RepID=A0A9J7AT66_9PROT|nr:PLP-dependent aspartate aminotransferase family protein [Nisaea acidiphila]UUX48557.1 PLP-dependent aspartate aminotransferase family protein [Nisaea acidiphila]